MTLSSMFAAAAGTLAVAQMVPYVISTVRGISRPSMVAVVISLVCNVVTVISMLAANIRIGIVLPIVFTGTNLITFALAFKWGDKKFEKSDMVNAAMAGLALVAWAVFGPEQALIAMFAAKVCVTVAVFRKMLRCPGTEDILSLVLSEAAAVLSVAGVTMAGLLTFPVLGGPIIGLINCSFLFGLALIQRKLSGSQVPALAGKTLRQTRPIWPVFPKAAPEFSLTA